MKGTQMSRNDNESEPADDEIEALLRQTGARPGPPAAVTEEIRRAIHAEWQTVAAGRKSRRRTIVFGLAASVAVAMLALALTLRSVAPPAPGPVAVLERIEGTLDILPTSDGATPVQAGRAIVAGETVVTDAITRAALRLAGRISVRLDSNTTLDVLAQDRLELRAGTVYVDAGPPERGYSPLEIVTAAGPVRHVGTQYQVHSQDGHVTISVREGRIELARARGPEMARAGERLAASSNGELARATVSADDPSWAWAIQIVPPFEIQDQPLTVFLEWTARETGRTLVYASPSVEAAARDLRLQGSIANLTPEAALAAVLLTTQFEQTESNDNLIRIAERAQR
jgi:ferric-dicitrate binding protein FerR (iron transport regulator)